MGASAIEQIYLPNLLSASGIKPTKFQKSEGDWVFKLARSTYAQAGEISPRTTTSRHRRTAPGAFRGHRRFPPRTLRGITAHLGTVVSSNPPQLLPAPHLSHSPEPPRTTTNFSLLRVTTTSLFHYPPICHSISSRTYSVPVNSDLQIKTIFSFHIQLKYSGFMQKMSEIVRENIDRSIKTGVTFNYLYGGSKRIILPSVWCVLA